VNDADQMARFMEEGVDGIITDDPELLLRVRAEREELSDLQRLVLASRHLLGMKR
jgi:glycerophosphoryl diester phosphodiesterase